MKENFITVNGKQMVDFWLGVVPEDVFIRLSACRTRKADLPILVNARWKRMKEQGKDKNGYTKEDALICVMELLDCNNQSYLIDDIDEYNELRGE